MIFLIIQEFQGSYAFFSDHFPILFEAGNFSWGSSPFQFYNSWLNVQDCVSIIEKSLSEDCFYSWAGFVIFAKLRNLKSVVKGLVC